MAWRWRDDVRPVETTSPRPRYELQACCTLRVVLVCEKGRFCFSTGGPEKESTIAALPPAKWVGVGELADRLRRRSLQGPEEPTQRRFLN